VNSYKILLKRRQGSEMWYTSFPISLTPLESKTPLKAKKDPISTRNATDKFASVVAFSTSAREDDDEEEEEEDDDES